MSGNIGIGIVHERKGWETLGLGRMTAAKTLGLFMSGKTPPVTPHSRQKMALTDSVNEIRSRRRILLSGALSNGVFPRTGDLNTHRENRFPAETPVSRSPSITHSKGVSPTESGNQTNAHISSFLGNANEPKKNERLPLVRNWVLKPRLKTVLGTIAENPDELSPGPAYVKSPNNSASTDIRKGGIRANGCPPRSRSLDNAASARSFLGNIKMQGVKAVEKSSSLPQSGSVNHTSRSGQAMFTIPALQQATMRAKTTSYCFSENSHGKAHGSISRGVSVKGLSCWIGNLRHANGLFLGNASAKAHNVPVTDNSGSVEADDTSIPVSNEISENVKANRAESIDIGVNSTIKADGKCLEKHSVIQEDVKKNGHSPSLESDGHLKSPVRCPPEFDVKTSKTLEGSPDRGDKNLRTKRERRATSEGGRSNARSPRSGCCAVNNTPRTSEFCAIDTPRNSRVKTDDVKWSMLEPLPSRGRLRILYIDPFPLLVKGRKHLNSYALNPEEVNKLIELIYLLGHDITGCILAPTERLRHTPIPALLYEGLEKAGIHMLGVTPYSGGKGKCWEVKLSLKGMRDVEWILMQEAPTARGSARNSPAREVDVVDPEMRSKVLECINGVDIDGAYRKFASYGQDDRAVQDDVQENPNVIEELKSILQLLDNRIEDLQHMYAFLCAENA